MLLYRTSVWLTIAAGPLGLSHHTTLVQALTKQEGGSQFTRLMHIQSGERQGNFIQTGT